MHPLQRPARKPHEHRDPPLVHYLQQTFPTADAVLLCCFGVSQHGERTSKELRRALLGAGFASQVTGHLIRSSSLLDRSGKGRYRIRVFLR
jgi:hypothetical protein